MRFSPSISLVYDVSSDFYRVKVDFLFLSYIVNIINTKWEGLFLPEQREQTRAPQLWVELTEEAKVGVE